MSKLVHDVMDPDKYYINHQQRFRKGKSGKMKKPLRWILALILVSVGAYTDSASPPFLPSPALTPGDVLTTDAKVVCTLGYTKTVRDVPQSVKTLVYRAYGITSQA
jgi:hypothetical protein